LNIVTKFIILTMKARSARPFLTRFSGARFVGALRFFKF
jgi:hypothetical protein